MKTSHGPGRVTLPRAISKLGFASRTRAASLIAGGEVKVNGVVERNPHRWIDLAKDVVEIGSERLGKPSLKLLMLHKPPGVVTTRSDERGARTVFEVLGKEADGLIAVGRLDKDSSGLLLFTNDHQLAERITNPLAGLPKKYLVTLDRPLRQTDREQVARGMQLRMEGREVRTKPAEVRVVAECTVEMSITEGKNRQIRRMMSELSYEVLDLKRIAIGTLSLGELKEGAFRTVSAEEHAALLQAVGTGRSSDSPGHIAETNRKGIRGKRRRPHS